ncbi:hypothetical protein BCR36DRAFT_409883 [Piromyces finnis]|uniref:Uncharacterized protein n=1 Tax=Piromyces finnis TaxID=1754191 RepID=A0A1Y1VI43_9FUNG|nr:hypothetical protein BCR36DRAFT_409883 [Piromyces finnis]|eukprot:ORX56699.1 hypothetical protein BCR36DRAFT_409883 [Piromyces finnis]
MCEDLIPLWPESTMKVITLIREYKYAKYKKEKMESRFVQKKSKFRKDNTSLNNIYVIKIIEKSKQQNDDLILPKFIKSTSICYPNHDKYYQRSVKEINNNTQNIIRNETEENNIEDYSNKNNKNMCCKKPVSINKFNELINHNQLLSCKLKNKSNYQFDEKIENLSQESDKLEIKNNDSINRNKKFFDMNISRKEKENDISQSLSLDYENSSDFNTNYNPRINQKLERNNSIEIGKKQNKNKFENQNSDDNISKILEILKIEINQLKDIIYFLQNHTDLDVSDSKLIFLSSLKDYFNMILNKILNHSENGNSLFNLFDLILSINPKKRSKTMSLKRSILKPKCLLSNTKKIVLSKSEDKNQMKSELPSNDKRAMHIINKLSSKINYKSEDLSIKSIKPVINISPSKNISLKRKPSEIINSPLKKIVKVSNNKESINNEIIKHNSNQEHTENFIKDDLINSYNIKCNLNKVSNSNGDKINQKEIKEASKKENGLNKINQEGIKEITKNDNSSNKIIHENILMKINNLNKKSVSRGIKNENKTASFELQEIFPEGQILKKDNMNLKNGPKPRAFSRRKPVQNKLPVTNINNRNIYSNKSIISFSSSDKNNNSDSDNVNINNKVKEHYILPLPKSKVTTTSNNSSLHHLNSMSFSSSKKNSTVTLNEIKNEIKIPITSISHKLNESQSNKISNSIYKPNSSISDIINIVKSNDSPPKLNLKSNKANKNKNFDLTYEIISKKSGSLDKISVERNFPSSIASSKIDSHSENCLNLKKVNKNNGSEPNRLDIIINKYGILKKKHQ